MKTLFVLATLALAALGCDDTTAPIPFDLAVLVPPDLATPPMVDAAQTASVIVEDNDYAPASTYVLQGGTVTWTWAADVNPHTVTSDADSAEMFDSGDTQQRTGSFTHTFVRKGTFGYHCRVLGSAMHGTVTVQ